MASRLMILLTALLCGLFGNSAEAKTRLYAANFSGQVSVFSVPDNKLIKVIDLGHMVDDVVGSPDGKVVYANLWVTENHKFLPNYGELVAISTETHEILWRLPMRDGWPHHIAISPDGKYIYSPVFDRTYVNVIDVEARKVVRRIDGVLGMHGTKLSKDGKRLYIGAMTMEALLVVDADSGETLNFIDFDGGVRPFDFNADETVFYTQLSRLHGFAVADLKSSKVVQTVHLPRLRPDTPLPASWPHTWDHGLELTKDGKWLLAAGSIEDFVALYSVPDLTQRAVIPICKEPNWIVITDDSRTAYTSCQGSGEVSIIDIEAQKEVGRMASGASKTVRMRLVDVPDSYSDK